MMEIKMTCATLSASICIDGDISSMSLEAQKKLELSSKIIDFFVMFKKGIISLEECDIKIKSI